MTTLLHGRAAGLDLIRRRDPRYDAARAAWNSSVDQRPSAVAVPEDAAEVEAFVREAVAAGLHVVPQGTGHRAGHLPDLRGTVLLRTSRLRSISIDPEARIARVGAGVEWRDVTAAAAEHGLAALAGSSPDVGVAGYVLGGGISWLARRHGLAANHVRALEVVLADGRRVRCSADEEPVLFWALRGGGGGFGVVTALELELFPLTEVEAGMLVFPFARADEVLGAWREWTAGVPDEVTSIGRLLRPPGAPPMAIVEVASLLPAGETAELLATLRALGPLRDTVAATSMTALSALHMDPPGPSAGTIGHSLLDELDTHTISVAVDAVAASSLVSFEIRHLGGAIGRPAPGGGALDHIPSPFSTLALGASPGVRADLARLREALAPWASSRAYVNFVESPEDRKPLHDPITAGRLAMLRHAFDPRGLFAVDRY